MAASYFMLKMLSMIKKKQKRKIKTESSETITSTKYSTAAANQCRICLKEGFIPIYGDSSSLSLPDEIKTFGDVEIDEGDDLPKYICESCRSLLKGAVLFRKCAKESQEILHKIRSTSFISSFTSSKRRMKNNSSDKLKVSNKTAKVSDDIPPMPAFEEDLPLPFIEEASNHSSDTKEDNGNICYLCKICNIEFVSSTELKTHKAYKHKRKILVQCRLCKKLLQTHYYKEHVLKHHSEPLLVCEVCGKKYKKNYMPRHMQSHSFELPFQCDQCPYRARNKVSLKFHMRTHTGYKPYSCNKCKHKFTCRGNLTKHLRIHNKERPHKCAECDRGFYTKRAMEDHFKSDHEGINSFSCAICGKTFGTKKSTLRHELAIHKRDTQKILPLYLQEGYKNNG